MCTHCGCHEPENAHGDSRSILLSDVKRAMKTRAHRKGGKGRDATANEMRRMVRRRK